MPVIPALGRLRQEDGEFEDSVAWAKQQDPVSHIHKKSK
jgi:hypothetical protein